MEKKILYALLVLALLGNGLGIAILAQANQPASGTVGARLSWVPQWFPALGVVNDGTAGIPAYTFQNDPDVGLYRSSANVLGVTAGGSSVGTFDSNGFNGAVVASSLKVGAETQSGAVRFGTAASYASGTSIAHGFTTTPTVCAIIPTQNISATFTITSTGFSSNMQTTASPVYWFCGK